MDCYDSWFTGIFTAAVFYNVLFLFQPKFHHKDSIRPNPSPWQHQPPSPPHTTIARTPLHILIPSLLRPTLSHTVRLSDSPQPMDNWLLIISRQPVSLFHSRRRPRLLFHHYPILHSILSQEKGRCILKTSLVSIACI